MLKSRNVLLFYKYRNEARGQRFATVGDISLNNKCKPVVCCECWFLV